VNDSRNEPVVGVAVRAAAVTFVGGAGPLHVVIEQMRRPTPGSPERYRISNGTSHLPATLDFFHLASEGVENKDFHASLL
jgi:hypothetical protein